MNIKQESKFKSMLATRLVCNDNSAITSLLPNFEEFYTSFNHSISQIEEHSELQQHFSGGVAKSKKQIRASLEETVIDSSKKLFAYATYAKDQVLQSESKLKDADIHSATDLTLLNNAKGLYSNIQGNLTNLAPYLLTAESQTGFLALIHAFEQAIPKTRQKQLSKKETIDLLAQEFEAADAALANMDTVVEIVRLSQPVFHASYKGARRVVETASGSLAINGSVMDAETGNPVVDATLTFCASGSNVPLLVKQSAAKGGFQQKSLAEGVYDVTVTKIGYVTQTIIVTVSSSELYTLDVKMVKG
ncbi:MAG: carboxypeptidase-like regulatory domain-containing protein [Bacteroidales bacterium]|nr:carboxypeptidase-like regulatory domain-containing protein [Bacteroidales bacterium]